MEPEQQIKILLEKDNWTDEERRWLLAYLDNTPAGELKSYLLQRFREEEQLPVAQHDVLAERLLQNIHRQIIPAAAPVVPLYRRIWKRVAVAAMIAVTLGAGYLMLTRQQAENVEVAALPASRFGNEVAPGTNKAKLVLGNGEEILLEETADGAIVAPENEHIYKRDAELVYDRTNGRASATATNILSTPNGGQYKVVLSDGTRVWLNAASSLAYPAAFSGNKREVVLTGEAYFEVAKDEGKPFLVTVNDMQVQVLGTHFNVKAYANDKHIMTTLLEGAVRVKKGTGSVMLLPGQQASLNKQDGVLRSATGDPELALAWKNGLLAFKNDALRDVMHTISRWYDVEVVYEAGIDKEAIHVSGAMRKQEYISKALEILELTAGIHFKVTGRTVTVSR